MTIAFTNNGSETFHTSETFQAIASRIWCSTGEMPHTNSLRLPLVSSVRYVGLATAAEWATLQDANARWLPEQFSGTNGAFYVQLLGGLQLDIAHCDAAAGKLDLTSFLPGRISAGAPYWIRKYHTISDIFGLHNEAGLQAGPTPELADNLLVEDPNLGRTIQCYFRNGSAPWGWFTAEGDPAHALTLSARQDFRLVRRSPEAAVFYFHGRVPSAGSIPSWQLNGPTGPCRWRPIQCRAESVSAPMDC